MGVHLPDGRFEKIEKRRDLLSDSEGSKIRGLPGIFVHVSFRLFLTAGKKERTNERAHRLVYYASKEQTLPTYSRTQSIVRPLNFRTFQWYPDSWRWMQSKAIDEHFRYVVAFDTVSSRM